MILNEHTFSEIIEYCDYIAINIYICFQPAAAEAPAAAAEEPAKV